MNHKSYELSQFKALGDQAEGQFEAIVSVFGNVDSYGDRVVKGAFAGSLERWRQKERPIPVVFSHQWDDLDAHIGQVLEAEERDEGLYVRAQLEMDEPFAARVYKKLKNGTLSEFSFAYDVLQSERVDGVNELRELELFEVGPTLVGANRETRLLAVKETPVAASDSESDDEGATEDEAGSTSKSSRPHPSVIAARVAIELASDDL